MGQDATEALLTENERSKALRDLIANVNSKRTICEVHREIFDEVYQLPDCGRKTLIIERLIEASAYAKKMSAKLFEYKADWEDGFYGANEDYSNDLEHRKKGRQI